mmetsp:Transcript_17594/g.68300  ORF Transcript_17594/g.68300 Transcript_17594/m.68300 type:complete len:384 (+) Transcript_17594:59-1210(+)
MGDPFVTTKAVHGQNPENLIETILKQRIFRNNFWKEKCYGLTAATLTEVAIELPYFGGTFGGNSQPTPFMCLLLAMLQIQPEKEIVVEYIKNEDYKYVRALGAFYLRLVGTPVEIYQYLEPLYYDYRKLKKRSDTGYSVVHMDEYIDELLWETHCFSIALPFLPRRWVLEGAGQLEPRVSLLDEDLEKEEAEEAERNAANGSDSGSDSELERSYKERSRRERWRKSRSSRDRRTSSRSRSRSRSPRRRRSRSRDSGRKRRYSSRSPDRHSRRSPSSHRDRYSSSRSSGHSRDDHDRRSDDRGRRDDRRGYGDRDRRGGGSRSHRSDRDEHRASGSGRSRDDTRNSSSGAGAGSSGGGKKGKDESMSVDETNALRAKLGLPPLK